MKKILSIALALVMVFGLMAGMQTSAVKNLMVATDETSPKIVNGFFNETRAEHGDNIMGVWGMNSDDIANSGVYALDSGVKKLGNVSIKIATKDKINVAYALFFINGLQAGKTYIAQYWLKTDNIKVVGETGGTKAAIYLYNTKDFIEGGIFDGTEVTGTKDWKQYSIKFTVPKNAVIDRALISLNIDNAIGTAWYDGIAVFEGTKPVLDYATIEGPSKPTPPPAPPKDEPSAWALAEVTEAVNAGLVPTALNSQFKSNITRSDFCDLIIKTIEVKKNMPIADFIATVEGTVDKTFTDTTSANVLAAAKLGIVNGRTETTFAPDAAITRQEATKMLTLAAQVLGADITADPTNFADEAQIAEWAKPFVAYCVKAQIMNGTSATTFAPLGRYTREQSMLTALRLFKAIG